MGEDCHAGTRGSPGAAVPRPRGRDYRERSRRNDAPVPGFSRDGPERSGSLWFLRWPSASLPGRPDTDGAMGDAARCRHGG